MMGNLPVALALAVALAAPTLAGERAPLSWSHVRAGDRIDVWAAEGDGDFWGFARGRVEASPDAILARITDFALLPSLHPWLDRVRVLARGPDSALVYFHYHLPWPLADRSYTVAHHWGCDAAGTAFLDVDDAGAGATPDDGAVHVRRFLVRMRFTPVEGGAAADVEYLLRADLAGFLPRTVRAQSAWKIPFNVVLALRRALERRPETDLGAGAEACAGAPARTQGSAVPGEAGAACGARAAN